MIRKLFREILISILDLRKGIHKFSNANHKSYDGASEHDSPNESIASLSRTLKAIEANNRKSSGEQEIQQRKIRHATWAGVFIVALYTTFTAFQWCEIRKANKTSHDQLGIMRTQLEMADRAWVTVEATACLECGPRDIRGSPLTFDKDGRGSLTAKFTLKNIGRSVAGHVYIRTKALAVGLVDPFDIPLNEQKALCNGPNAYVRDKPNIDTRYTIFPKDSQVEFDMTGFGTKQIKEMVLDLTLKNGKPVVPLLVGCVDYDYPSASVPHQTGFIYEVYGKNPVHGIQTSMTFRVDQLEFRPYTFGGKYAY